MNSIKNDGPAFKANVGGHFFYDFSSTKKSNISAYLFLESPTFNANTSVLEKPIDFSYELLFKADNQFAKKLGVSLFNTKFYAQDQKLDAAIKLETVDKNGINLKFFL